MSEIRKKIEIVELAEDVLCLTETISNLQMSQDVLMADKFRTSNISTKDKQTVIRKISAIDVISNKDSSVDSVEASNSILEEKDFFSEGNLRDQNLLNINTFEITNPNSRNISFIKKSKQRNFSEEITITEHKKLFPHKKKQEPLKETSIISGNVSKQLSKRSINTVKINSIINSHRKGVKKITPIGMNEKMYSRNGTKGTLTSGNNTIVPTSHRDYNDVSKNTQRLKEFELLIKSNPNPNSNFNPNSNSNSNLQKRNKEFFYSPAFTTQNNVNKQTVSLSKYQYLFSDVENKKNKNTRFHNNYVSDFAVEKDISNIQKNIEIDLDLSKKKNSIIFNNSNYSNLFS